MFQSPSLSSLGILSQNSISRALFFGFWGFFISKMAKKSQKKRVLGVLRREIEEFEPGFGKIGRFGGLWRYEKGGVDGGKGSEYCIKY
jgi:hypothetical protein